MPLTLAESQAVNQMAGLLYDFLPGTPYPRANPNISFPGVARELGLSQYWTGGSKLPAISVLLEQTLTHQRNKFCPLVEGIVRKGITHRLPKKPITREEIEQLNKLMLQVQFKSPLLWDPNFLGSLPTQSLQKTKPPDTVKVNLTALATLKEELVKLASLDGGPRGFAFERFLQELFFLFDLAPRSSFRLVGEQIDGSFQLGDDTYLIEAKWHKQPIGDFDLSGFSKRVEKKSHWSRGVFLSYGGFSGEGLEAFSRGQATNLIGIDGQDLYFILEGEISLPKAILQKTRRAAETGEFFVPIYQLIREGYF